VRLAVQAPFHLEATVRVLQRRPTNLVDTWDEQRYRRAVLIRGRPVVFEVCNRGDIDAPDVRMTLLTRGVASGSRAETATIATAILGLGHDPAVYQRRAQAEPGLRATALALRGMRPPRYPDLFQTFANVIPFQQVSLAAGMAVVAQLIRRFGQVLLAGGRESTLFPTARAVADAGASSLRQCGMSMHKAQALRAIAGLIASGALTAGAIESLSSNEAIDWLTRLPGIGPWSAALVLLRGFGRLDVFPAGDSGAQGNLVSLMHLRSRDSLARIAARFGTQRGCLYFYGLASRQLAAGLIHPAGPPRGR